MKRGVREEKQTGSGWKGEEGEGDMAKREESYK